MPTQKPTGVKNAPTTGQQLEKQSQKVPSIKASIDWLNQKDDGNIRASGSLVIGGAFAVHGVKVVSGQNGAFVSMPNFKKGNEYKDTFHAITAEARQQMNDTFMKAYEQKLADQNQSEELAEDEQSEAPSEESDHKEQTMNSM